MGGKATEEELRALVAQDSSNLQTLAVPEYKPTEPPNSLDTVDKRTWEDQDRFQLFVHVGITSDIITCDLCPPPQTVIVLFSPATIADPKSIVLIS